MIRRRTVFVQISIFFFLLLLLQGCAADGGRVTVRETLSQNPNAGIIYFDNGVYSNVTDVEWFQDEDGAYEKGDKIGEIKKQTIEIWGFEEFYATKLPKGAPIFTNTLEGDNPGIIIVEVDGETLYYFEQLEGI